MKSAPKEIREFCNWGHNQAWECFLRMRDGSPESWDWAGITVTWWRWGGDHAQEREEQTPSPGRSSVHTDPSRESWACTLQMCTVFFFLAALGLCCDMQAPHCGGLSCCGAQALSRACGLRSRGPRAQFPHGMWGLPKPGIELMSPALQGRLLTTVPPRKSLCGHFVFLLVSATSSSSPL